MMVLSNVRLVDNDSPTNIGIEDGKITSVGNIAVSGKSINFTNAIALPGLINSHDHLDFNLFPQLGDRVYNNYVEWGQYIQQNYRNEIDEVLRIPVALRAQWGMYKNLLAGVTTVVDHGVDHQIDNPLITIFKDCQSLHSVALEKLWKLRLNNPLKAKIPAVIHIGEGTDIGAFTETNRLLRWSLLKRELVAIHGVAMKPSQAINFKALVWCLQTNHFLLQKTADIETLKKHTAILFGTDSTLTSHWDIWEHLRFAQGTRLLNDAELSSSITNLAAKIWKLNTGEITPGKDADIVIVKNKGNSIFDTTPADILMVMHQGNIRLFDEELFDQIAEAEIDINIYSKIYIGESCKYVQGDLPGLIAQIRRYHPGAAFPKEISLMDKVKADCI